MKRSGLEPAKPWQTPSQSADLREIRRVVGVTNGGHNFLTTSRHLAGRVLETAHLLVTEGEVLGDGDGAFELHLGRRVMAKRMHRLR